MPRKTATCLWPAGDLFGESLITEQVKSTMYLNTIDQEKAEKLIDCVRTKVAIAPEKIYVFINVLRRHGGEEAAKTLEEMLPDLPKLPKWYSKFWLVILLALVMCAVYYSSPGKSPSLPVLQQELIGREEEMKVIANGLLQEQ